MIGRIQRVPLREVWKHEPNDFTAWLEENVDVLNDAIDLALVSVDREQSAGNFSVDLVAEDNGGNVAVIENQLERSDHDHLGKLLTCLSALDAKIAIWIVSDPRPEHVKAITWLNESSAAAFYLVKVEAIKIPESPPAPLLTLITGPSEEATRAGEIKKESTERHRARQRFWTDLLARAKQKTKLHAGISPGQYSWVGTSTGLPYGLVLLYAVRQHDAEVQLFIDSGKPEANMALFDQLLSQKEPIEREFGGALEWEALEGKRACKIKKTLKIAGWRDEEKWPAAHADMIDAMINLERALRPHLSQVVIPRT